MIRCSLLPAGLPVLLILTMAIGAGSAGVAALSLQEAIDRAISSHPRILESRAQVEQMSAAVQQAEAGLGWRLDTSLNAVDQKASELVQLPYEISGQDVPETYVSYSGSLALSKGFAWSAENRVPKQQGQLGLDSAREQLRSIQASLLADVVKAYYDVWKAQDALELARAAQREAELALDIAVKKHEKGSSTESDVTSARTRLLQARSGVKISERGLELALRLFANLIGRESISPRYIDPPRVSIDRFPVDPCPWSWDVDEMIDRALRQRPEIKLANLAVSRAELDIELAREKKRPQAKLSGSYTWNKDQLRFDSILNSEGRWSAVVSKWDTSLPEVERSELTDQEWEALQDFWDRVWENEPPDWSPTREQVNNMLMGQTAGTYAAEDTWEIKLDVTFNLFDSGLTGKQIQAATARLDEARARLQSAQQMVELEILQLYTELLEAHKTVGIARSDLEQATQLYAQTIKTRDYGALTPHDEERLNVLLKQKSNQLNAALYDYEVAKAKLGAAIGMDIDWVISGLIL